MLNRKALGILIFIIILAYFSKIVYASNSAVVYLTSDKKEINSGEDIEITVNIENSKVAACNFSVYFEEENFEFISALNQENNSENVKSDKNKINFVWFDKLGGKEPKEGNIVSFKFFAKGEGRATFTIKGEFYNQNGQLIEAEFKEETVIIRKERNNIKMQTQEEQGTNFENSNCNLQALRLNIQGLVPSFKKDVEEYYLVVPNNIQDLDVLAISENPNATVEISGNNNLKGKVKDIEIKVTSADETQSKIYKIHVSKTDNLELANTNLEILAIENTLLNPPFDNLQTNYEAEVSNQTESINIFAVPENEKASVQIMGKDNLKEGSNLVTVLVKAEDGFTKKNYVIKVNRRNLIEEEKYKEEQSKQIEALENAYKVEKTSTDMNNSKVEKQEKQSQQNHGVRNLLIAILVVIAIAILTLKIIKTRKLKK